MLGSFCPENHSQMREVAWVSRAATLPLKGKNPQNSISSVVAWRIWALWRQCFSLKGFCNFHLNFKCWLGPLQCSIYFASGSYSCLFNPKAWKVTRDFETFLPIKYLFQRYTVFEYLYCILGSTMSMRISKAIIIFIANKN